jgi:hypothetical protein
MSATPADVIRPVAILAVAAFVLGFTAYLALGGQMLAPPAPADQPAMVAEPAAEAAAPAARPDADDWNLPKRI